jgi:transmembrane sensor
MSESIELTLLGRYLDETASPIERAAVEAWIGADAERRAAIAELRRAWSAEARVLAGRYDVSAAWARVARQLGAAVVDVVPAPAPRRVERSIPLRQLGPAGARVGVWAAAIVVALAVSGGGAWLAFRGHTPPPAAPAPAMREYAAARGQRAIIRLLDGSEVMLNVDSRLRIPATFGTTRRDVYLDGEAYFTVLHDTTRPFAVHTAHGVARDVGTKFGVRAYADDPVERVMVAEGAVAVTAVSPVTDTAVAPMPRATPDVPIHAGQLATLAPSGDVTLVRRANVARELAWTRGRLEFRDVSLGEVARRLGRWYDLDVHITDPQLARRPVTGSYGDEPIVHVLTVITAAVGARFEWRGRTVTISPADGAR